MNSAAAELTNVLVEGGSKLLGTLFDMRAVDEVHVFIAPKVAGGAVRRARWRRGNRANGAAR